MITHIAPLRGVNVGGNVLTMERLREIFSQLGFQNARTYVQSGNVVFDAGGAAAKICQAIEQKLAGETRLGVSVISRTAAEVARVVSDNPFLREKGIDRSKLHVTFLAAAATRDALKALSEIDAGGDRFRALGNEIYLHCPDGYGKTRLSNNRLEKVLAVKATTRNWNTVNKLHEMAGS